MQYQTAIDREMYTLFSLYEKDVNRETLSKEINRFLVELRKRDPNVYQQIVQLGKRIDVLQDYKNDFIKLCMFVYFYPFEVSKNNIQLDSEMLLNGEYRGIDLVIDYQERCKQIIGLVHAEHDEILEFVHAGHPVIGIGADLQALEGDKYEIVYQRFLNEDIYVILSTEIFHELKTKKGTPLWYNLML